MIKNKDKKVILNSQSEDKGKREIPKDDGQKSLLDDQNKKISIKRMKFTIKIY